MCEKIQLHCYLVRSSYEHPTVLIVYIYLNHSASETSSFPLKQSSNLAVQYTESDIMLSLEGSQYIPRFDTILGGTVIFVQALLVL